MVFDCKQFRSWWPLAPPGPFVWSCCSVIILLLCCIKRTIEQKESLTSQLLRSRWRSVMWGLEVNPLRTALLGEKRSPRNKDLTETAAPPFCSSAEELRQGQQAKRRHVQYLRTSGGSFIEARLTWVRLKAELKNWRNNGSVSFTFLSS